MRPRGGGPAVRAAAARRCLWGRTRGGRCNCIPRLAGPWPSISLIDGRPNMFGVLMMFTVITISLWMGHQTRQHTPARESPGFTLPAPAPAVTVARTQAGPAPAPRPPPCYTYNGGKITNDPFLFRYLHLSSEAGRDGQRAQHWHSTYLTTHDHRKFLKIVSLFLFTTHYSHPTRQPPFPAPVQIFLSCFSFFIGIFHFQLPKYEVWPGAADNVDYIDLQYDSTVYKVQDEKEDSPSKFNSLPTIKSGRKARYISAIEAISLPKSEAKADLSIDVPDVSVPMTPEVDNDSKLSETTTVVIHESPRGIANEAFEDDEDTLDAKKPRGGESPTHSSSVSYSSHDSTVNMPEVDIDAAIKKKMESEGYSKQMIEGQLKKKWR